MLKELTTSEAEAMNPLMYAAAVGSDDYGEYAERTECDYAALVPLLSNPRTGRLIVQRLAESVVAGHKTNDLKKFLFYGKNLPVDTDIDWPVWWEAGTALVPSEQDQGIMKRLADRRFQRLLHVGAGLQTEAAEFNEALYDYLLHGRDLDHVNLSEELGDVCWYVGIGCRILGVTLSALLRQNIAKLFQRFRGKFCYKRVDKRDLSGERAVLEGGQ